MIVAVDVGSINLIVAGLNESGKIVSKVKMATPETANDTADVIIAAIISQFTNKSFSAIFIGIPGPIKNNRVAWCSNMGEDWTDYDLITKLKEVFNVPIYLENDANLAGLGEVNALAQTPKSAIYLSIGAGIGSGFIGDGKLVKGLLHSEAGMTSLEYDGVVREWERFASGKAIVQDYGQLVENITNKSILQAVADRISRGILVLIPIIQPELIIIGGSVGKNFHKYGKMLNDFIDEGLSPKLNRPKIIAANEPEMAVIYGIGVYAKTIKR